MDVAARVRLDLVQLIHQARDTVQSVLLFGDDHDRIGLLDRHDLDRAGKRAIAIKLQCRFQVSGEFGGVARLDRK